MIALKIIAITILSGTFVLSSTQYFGTTANSAVVEQKQIPHVYVKYVTGGIQKSVDSTPVISIKPQEGQDVMFKLIVIDMNGDSNR